MAFGLEFLFRWSFWWSPVERARIQKSRWARCSVRPAEVLGRPVESLYAHQARWARWARERPVIRETPRAIRVRKHFGSLLGRALVFRRLRSAKQHADVDFVVSPRLLLHSRWRAR